MQSHKTAVAAILLSACAALPATAADPALTGALPTPANRIVGLWEAVAEVGPCGGTPGNRIAATITYHAGGTLSETNTMPIAGIPNLQGVPGNNQRGPGMGTWKYNPVTRQYSLSFRFNWFVNGVYHGYQQIERTGLLLSTDGQLLSGPVHATRYLADGTRYAEFCGRETAVRQ
jgi:hypothetical protein